MATQITQAEWNEVKTLRARGDKILAIKRLRQYTGWGLKESKELVIDHCCDEGARAAADLWVVGHDSGEPLTKMEVARLILAKVKELAELQGLLDSMEKEDD